MKAEHRVRGLHFRTGRAVELLIGEGRIQSLSELSDQDSGGGLPWLAPGLVDLQVNGCFGLDVNTLPLMPETVADMVRALRREGVTTFCPTVITNSAAAIGQAVQAIALAARRFPEVRAAVAGIHLEGPFISPADGARGAHPAEHVAPPDWDVFRGWQDAAAGLIRIVTLSPEWPGASDFIARCADSGVIVSIGHTAASPEQIRAAVAAGATMSTHLGNGIQPMLPRHPNPIWEQLAADELHGCMIADGFHLPPSVLKVIMRMKGKRAVVVSDAVSFSGMPPGAYSTHIGGSVVLTPEGRLHLAEQPQLLAGSAMLLKEQVAYLTGQGLASLAGAWDLASAHPAELLGLPQAAGLTEGAPADFVLFERKGHALKIVTTYKAGIPDASE
ncbi:N-acetylglucosamine-6-phosphate deacetylase [Paenibacillus nanensis]|uniref:N-acetylglucosamine-6-phosphate deacetylase n=1 Tax=Paenibacillus nanensis TaxID=393251 RepID=A0A3A1UV41_9BACL|nr:N-acetylglucosamine-6-phosphate deacetylase [Paenibacillus nanensis]